MTELEKAASGLLYDANSDPALLEARAQTSDLCMDYNTLRSSQKEEKNALLHTILGACAPDIVIEPPFFCRLRQPYACRPCIFMQTITL